MAVPTNTRLSYKSDGVGAGTDPAPGIREDLSNIIYNISPEETPFMSGIGRSSCDNTYFEWQIDSLEDPDVSNRQVEGDNAEALQAIEPLRVGNYTQISRKVVQSSGTAEAVDFAGRKSTQAYQMAKRGKELKLDMEKMLLELATAPTAGTSSTARQTGSVGNWITSNVVAAGGPVDGPFSPRPPKPPPGPPKPQPGPPVVVVMVVGFLFKNIFFKMILCLFCSKLVFQSFLLVFISFLLVFISFC